MTSLQKLPPPMARLFTHIDSAGATDAGLKHVTALFDVADETERTEVEILAAPLAGNGAINSVFCSIVRRKRQ